MYICFISFHFISIKKSNLKALLFLGGTSPKFTTNLVNIKDHLRFVLE